MTTATDRESAAKWLKIATFSTNREVAEKAIEKALEYADRMETKQQKRA